MKYQSVFKLVGFTFITSLLVTGCQTAQERICPPALSFADVVTPLKTNSAAIVPLRASGSCHLKYKSPDKKINENFSVKIWFLPPDRIRLYGDIAFNSKGIDLGSNADEFWLALRPKDFRSYYWGQWSQQTSEQFLLINPKTLVEALGVLDPVDVNQWTSEQNASFDVLVLKDQQGTVIKKLFINRCTRFIEKIEYFQAAGTVLITVDLKKYRAVNEKFSAPSRITITTAPDDKTSAVFMFSLDSFKPQNFSQQQLDVIFTRPANKDFEHIYKIIDDKTYEEP